MLHSDNKIGLKIDLNPFFSRKTKVHYNSIEILYNGFYNKGEITIKWIFSTLYFRFVRPHNFLFRGNFAKRLYGLTHL